VEIVALSPYRKAVKRLLTESERLAMELTLAADPLAYPLIPRSSGFRKADDLLLLCRRPDDLLALHLRQE
jgi:hypothetical protein